MVVVSTDAELSVVSGGSVSECWFWLWLGFVSKCASAWGYGWGYFSTWKWLFCVNDWMRVDI